MTDPESAQSYGATAGVPAEAQASVQAQLTMLSKAIAELKIEVSDLRAENIDLRAENTDLRTRLSISEAGREAAEATLKVTIQKLKKSEKRAANLEEELADVKSVLASVTQELRKSHGHDRSSEKGTALSPDGAGGERDDGTPPPPAGAKCLLDNKARYKKSGLWERLIRKMRRRAEKVAGFLSKSMLRSKWLRDHGSDGGLIPVCQDMMRSPLADTDERREERKVTMDQRNEHFGKGTGLSSSMDRPSRWDFQIKVTHLICEHETLTDPATGKSFRAGELDFGPKGYKITWRALTNIILMVAEYAIPMERIGRLLGIRYFSSSNISRWLQMVAEHLLPIYIAQFKALAGCQHLRMDDTNTLVLGMRKDAEDDDFCADADMSGEEFEDEIDEIEAEATAKYKANLVAPLARIMGRVAQYAKGEGGKKGINLTVISGQVSPQDSRSTVFFFRTHFGQAGNLVSRVLEQRSSKEKFRVFIQCDQSHQNNVEKSIARWADIIYLGCYAHARRPFAKHVKDDEELCYYLLRAFLLIAHCEEQAFSEHVSRERILRFRRKERFVWRVIRDVCEHVVRGEKHRHAKNKVWKHK